MVKKPPLYSLTRFEYSESITNGSSFGKRRHREKTFPLVPERELGDLFRELGDLFRELELGSRRIVSCRF
uniref:Uncharacterized protein n=1 Tax=Candidatus Kentrum sp. LFY TaxID=2126342 RepID=A0A450UCR1_9GAMM|nr:MAG: hypothetical protein BECKLFY1418A_GA0070994_101011 [Candidatus Kentron sp. LFY]